MTDSPVSTFTEWDRLREVIVGDFRNYTIPKSLDDVELSFRSFYHDNIFLGVQKLQKYKLNVYAEDMRTYPERIEEERAEDLDGVAKVLESFDVTVKRPLPMTTVQEFKTPDWVNVTTPCGNVRDQFLVIGDEIIETSPMMRGRYFENDHVKHLFLDYFRRGARWTVAPRPRMLEESFDRSYFNESTPESDANNFEIMFDGAQCLKLGTDILFNVSTQNHILGAIWLQRHLGERFTVHQVRFTDHHIDGVLLPLRPGTFLIHRRIYEKRDQLMPPALQKWDMIVFADEPPATAVDAEVMLASKSISMNVFSIDAERVMINKDAVNTIRALERAGFTPVPTQLRHSRLYAGAFHCSTLDIRRDGGLESYL
ncbi:MAG TPA: glycine amidinotransferase [Actinophytocola sp.]|uniref:glycine amidinotransferase n=1 Tax=Actinophytocola sp. TaxID=1872138 RepID=UPI002DBA9EAC|nr:glycine amidinotransferase [Actinophytocola sp.]HEU5475938.1 glycine amidinotransferase [Actinophytocola sp.]